ncbi:hypothetical protein [Pseudarthrobacter siccitolerans]
MQTKKTFVCLTGDYPNIGDALIRRRSLAWARQNEQKVNAFVGRAPDIWCKQIGLGSDDVVYRQEDVASWILELVRAPRRSLLVLEPGEVDLRDNQYKWEILVLLFTLIVRLKGGVVVRPPRALRNPGKVVKFIHALGVRLSQYSYWREASSLSLMKTGLLAPDIGFSEPPYGVSPTANRKFLTISLRGAREIPSDSWFEAVRDVAKLKGLDIVVVSQVRQDEKRSSEIALRLNGQMHNFEDRDDFEHEEYLRNIYSLSELVVSDRLHVLILAALGGATPCEIVPNPSGKIARHFETVGLPEISFDCAQADTAEIHNFLTGIVARRDEVSAQFRKAARDLAAIEDEIASTYAVTS